MNLKKWTIAVVLAVISLTVLAMATGSPAEDASLADGASSVSSIQVAADVEDEAAAVASKTLVVYFSREGNTNWDDEVDVVSSASVNAVNGGLAGNTRLIADMVAAQLDCDTFAIEVAETERYPSDYRATTARAQEEQLLGLRPELAAAVAELGQYTDIVLCYPNWWSKLPPPVASFVTENSLAGKRLIPLVTHGGSGLGGSVTELRNLCTDSTVDAGLAIAGEDVASAEVVTAAWLEQLGLL